MTDDVVPSDPDANPFIDNEALKELSEKIVDHNRSLGLTIDAEQIQFTVHPTHGMVAMIPALVRPSAKEKMEESKEARAAFNVMMANNADEKVNDTLDEIKAMVNADNFAELLSGEEEVENECKHERRHPDGFCLDCGDGMEG